MIIMGQAVSSFLSRSGPLVLVADDSATILAMVSSRLERAGYEVVTAANGEDALRLARERKPLLAVLDVEMPGVDGYEVARRLRADDDFASLPIVLLTARAAEAEIATGYAAGANDYIVKPFSPQELQHRIERLLGRR